MEEPRPSGGSCRAVGGWAVSGPAAADVHYLHYDT